MYGHTGTSVLTPASCARVCHAAAAGGGGALPRMKAYEAWRPSVLAAELGALFVAL